MAHNVRNNVELSWSLVFSRKLTRSFSSSFGYDIITHWKKLLRREIDKWKL